LYPPWALVAGRRISLMQLGQAGSFPQSSDRIATRHSAMP
jgi:hypothetical protein